MFQPALRRTSKGRAKSLGKASHSDMEDKSEKDIPKWALTPSPVVEEEETNVNEEVRECSVCFR